ncbi:PAS domain-containing protein [Halorhodospira halophila]|uniref:Putative PAS/PAC sensor protein n=1 Tax=Halorhodospira halophila (strain DSM 244 / SL1) TaxID=349124 RepID=A1WU01_HALHL|nr:PAS domain-containing protein [Halorhodospira halophila]ABM61163.1 putative PAS/PAC sensor protein [Halorhodospira halophila SL1]
MKYDAAAQPSAETRLRHEAEQRLVDGNAPSAGGWTISAETLSLLYRLASQPERAADALKLLHELQTHQVELDLQQEYSEANEQALTEELHHYRTLFEHAPVGYFVLDLEGRLLDTNRLGAEWLNLEASAAAGQPLSWFLDPGCRQAFTALLETLRQGGSGATCHVCTPNGADAPQRWRIDAALGPGVDNILVVASATE